MDFTLPKNTYFSAANGFSGFRSYFPDTFNPKNYERVFILKGGPGTGKSTLMKKMLKSFEGPTYHVEAILCSSDPASLDGIIIEKEKQKIAVIDGTAPHQTDPKLPGCVDEIINLGSAWSCEYLIAHREEIEKLNTKKAEHYKRAYNFLHLGGNFFECISRIVNRAYKKNDSQLINDILYDIKHINSGSIEKVRLLSCFGKNGYKRLDITSFTGKHNISVSGRYGSEFIFMNHLLHRAKNIGTKYIRYPSPYSDELTEAIYLEESDTFILCGDDFSDVIDSSAFLSEYVLGDNIEGIDYCYKEFENVTQLSEKEFMSASESHFALESIYTAAMNFGIIKDIEDKLREDIYFYLK